MTNFIGWQTIDYAATIKQGSDGQQQAVMTVTAADGSAISSYDDWTAEIVFVSPFTNRTVITLTSVVVGDSGAKTLTIVLVFTPDMTEDLQPGVYPGDIVMTSVSQGRYLPLNQYQLTIEGSLA